MWIFLWFVASAFILGVFGWSLFILQQQKRGWSAFAKKHNLSYMPGKMVEAPAIKGSIFGYKVAFFPDVQATQDQRNQRFITALEFDLGETGISQGVIASPNYAGFIAELPFAEALEIEDANWDKARIIRTSDKEGLKSYLTPQRLEFLNSVMTMKNSTALFYLNDNSSILHIETTDPIRDPARFEKIVQKITSSFDKMKQTPAERANRG